MTYSNSPKAEVVPHYCLSFSISTIFRGKRVVKVGPKVQTLSQSLFYENSSIFFQAMVLFARVLPMRILAILDHIWGSKRPKTSQKGPFHDAESARKTFNLTKNAILMKRTTIKYFHESVNWKPLRTRNSVFWRNSVFIAYIKNRQICHALPCVVSLVKFL